MEKNGQLTKNVPPETEGRLYFKHFWTEVFSKRHFNVFFISIADRNFYSVVCGLRERLVITKNNILTNYSSRISVSPRCAKIREVSEVIHFFRNLTSSIAGRHNRGTSGTAEVKNSGWFIDKNVAHSTFYRCTNGSSFKWKKCHSYIKSINNMNRSLRFYDFKCFCKL